MKCDGCKWNLDGVCHFTDDKGCALDYEENGRNN